MGDGTSGSVAVAAPDPVLGSGRLAPAVGARPQWLGSICPYVRADDDGSWRSAVPMREHRCWAVEPHSALPTATQQELCLTAAHGGCERFLHARDQRAAALAQDQIEVGRLESARFGPFVSPVPIAVDVRPPSGDHGGRSTSGRRRVPGLLIGAGVILVGVVALAAILGGGRSPSVAVISPTPMAQRTGAPGGQGVTTPLSSNRSSLVPIATPVATPRPPARPTPVGTRAASTTTGGTAVPKTPEPVATLRPQPTATIRPAPTPVIARKYTVKSGDTIKSIATKFGLKPRDLRAVNHIGKNVAVGQRLLIPAGPISSAGSKAAPTPGPTPTPTATPIPTRRPASSGPQS